MKTAINWIPVSAPPGDRWVMVSMVCRGKGGTERQIAVARHYPDDEAPAMVRAGGWRITTEEHQWKLDEGYATVTHWAEFPKQPPINEFPSNPKSGDKFTKDGVEHMFRFSIEAGCNAWVAPSRVYQSTLLKTSSLL